MDEDSKPSDMSLRRATVAAFCTGLLALVLFCASAPQVNLIPIRLGTSIALALGASMVGGLLGFLFGIPRTQQRDFVPQREGAGEPGDISYQVNTNLEQISDWLTKIIIGIGLVQLGAIGTWISQFSTSVGDGFFPGSPLAHTFALGVLMYFLILGFLSGYLWTRLYFGIAVRQADQGLLGRIEKWEQDARNDGRAMLIATRQLNLGAGEAPVSASELTSAIGKASQHMCSRIFYEALSARRRDERRALSIPVFKALIAADTARIYHQNHAQLAYALKDKSDPEWEEAERELGTAIEIRDRRGDEAGEYEFNRAICRINLGRPRSEIEADFRAAAQDEWVRTWSLDRVSQWLAENSLAQEDLGFLPPRPDAGWSSPSPYPYSPPTAPAS